MDGLSARIESFKKSKRVKNPNKPSSTITLKWPHPSNFNPSPEALADAGFYYSPSPEDLDNVTCFVCGKELSGWEEDDDPFELHYLKCSESCCWANVQCGLRTDIDKSGRFTFPNKARLPTHKNMDKARLETFTLGKGWVHDKAKNHGANSNSMAKAGFVYTPQETGDDLATCLYCSVSLSGWDDDDDPMEEHRRRADKLDEPCPFFHYTETQPTKPASRSQTTKPPSKSQSKPPSRTSSRAKQHEDIILPTKDFDGEEEESDAPVKKPGKASSAKTPRKARSGARKSSTKTPKAKSRSTSRTTLQEVLEEIDEEEEASAPPEEDPQPPPAAKKKGRPRSKSVAKAPVVKVEEDLEEPPVTARSTRSRSKSVLPSEIISDNDEPPPKASRAKSKAKAKSFEEDEPEETATLRKSTRSRKPKASVAPVVDDPPRKPSRAKSKPLVADAESEEEEIEAVVAKPKPATKKRTVSRSKSKVPTPEPESEEEETIAPPPPKQKKASNVRPMPISKTTPAAKDLFDDDVVMDDYLPPQSDALDEPPSVVEVAPEPIIPKRTSKRDSQLSKTPSELDDSSQPVESEKRKPGRPSKAKPTANVAGPSNSQQRPPQAEIVVEPSPAVKPEIPESVVKKPNSKPKAPKAKSPMKVVEVSSDEDESEVEPDTDMRVDPPKPPPPATKPKQDVFGLQKANANRVSSNTEGPPKHRASEDTERGRARSRSQSHKPISIQRPPESSKPVETPRAQPQTRTEDVDMEEHHHEPEPESESDIQEVERDSGIQMQIVPSTPPRPKTPLPAPVQECSVPVPQNQVPVAPAPVPAPSLQDAPNRDEPLFFPPLARIPFMPLPILTEAELDMTVEEWIRYQIEVEQDRFRRDGERELERVIKQAEEVRKKIESL